MATALAIGITYFVIARLFESMGNVSQLPPVLESLTGIKFERLLEQVPALRRAMDKEPAPTEKQSARP